MATKYGYEKTIHKTTKLDIEIDEETGEIVAVWFRCMMIPFVVHKANKDRADEMKQATKQVDKWELLGVDIETDTKVSTT